MIEKLTNFLNRKQASRWGAAERVEEAKRTVSRIEQQNVAEAQQEVQRSQRLNIMEQAYRANHFRLTEDAPK